LLVIVGCHYFAPMVSIRHATEADIPAIQQIATDTWWPTYRPILTDAQIEYMLALFYSPEAIASQMQDGHTYVLLLQDDIAKGFASYAARTENKDIYKLHRLYCLPETQGKGYGSQLMQYVEAAIKTMGKDVLELNVNIHNPANGFYERLGYIRAYAEKIDIGSGYIMDDYVMRKQL
jgi:GNAT superfamily N-acetyltransferase